jgi:cyclophilin family peptidyl-prolyl cis-trans isomerase
MWARKALTAAAAASLVASAVVLLATPAAAQLRSPRLTTRDSALVRLVLLTEDRRDSSVAGRRILADGQRHADPRIRLLARRAAARIADPRFVARDSFPPLQPPPGYAAPAWRVRYRALTSTDCAGLRTALTDSAWPVRLHAADLTVARAGCASDSALGSLLVSWAAAPPPNAHRSRGTASWQPAAHAILALARLAPEEARRLLPDITASPIPWLRIYGARAGGTLGDTALLRHLARDTNANVVEAAIEALTRVAGHTADDEYLAALGARGYQAVRAAARALAGSPRGSEVLSAAAAAARRLRADSSETSRDARLAVLERVREFAGAGNAGNARDIGDLASDFDCVVARAAAAIVNARPRCTPLPVRLPPDAAALALGRDARLRVTLADSSGGGSFTVRLRGDVAPIMGARVLALARAGYYDGLTWHRVEPDFVIQGGGPGANEYVGYPRFFRDELGTVSHVRGTIGMSTRGRDTGDAQWFVNLKDNLRLDRDYTVFAEVIGGIEIVDGILEGDVIERVEVLGVGRRR